MKSRRPTSTIYQLLCSEIFPSDSEPQKVDLNGTGVSPLDSLINLVKVPFMMEHFMAFGVFSCASSLLTLLTIVPLRLFVNLTSIGRSCFLNQRDIRQRLKFIEKDLVVTAGVGLTLILLHSLDTSKIYHNIRAGTAVKLYVMVNVLDVAEKLLSSIGHDILKLLFKVDASYRKLGALLAAVLYLYCHSYILVYQIISLNVAINSYSNALLTLILSNQFAELKSSIFKKFDREGLFQIAIADLSERFQLLFFLMVISIRNFLQLYSPGTTASVTSQFLEFYLKPKSWISFGALNWLSPFVSSWINLLAGPMFIVIGSELLVDLVKHYYILKFNKIKPEMFAKFLRILSIDHLNNIHSEHSLDDIVLSRRIGLPMFAMLIVLIKMTAVPFVTKIAATNGTHMAIVVFILVILVLLVVRMSLTLFLLRWSNFVSRKYKSSASSPEYTAGQPSPGVVEVNDTLRKHLYDKNEQMPPSAGELRVQKGRTAEKDKRLERVNRYEMSSKRIW